MKKLIIIVIILVILGVGGFLVWKMLNPVQEEPINHIDNEVTVKGLAEETNVVSTSIKENASGVNRRINVTYPSIQSFKNKNFQKLVNDEITKVIFAYIDEIKTVVDKQTDITSFYTYDSSYEKFTHGDYLSLVISNSYQTGGIRSNEWKDIYNIDCKAERILKLNDIFAANVDYKKEILDEVNKQAEKNGYVLMNGAGLLSINDNQKFYIKDEKLIIYYDPSEIAPASYGELQFEMPFEFVDGKFIK